MALWLLISRRGPAARASTGGVRRHLAQLRIVNCTVDADVAFRRALRRAHDNPVRRARAGPDPQAEAERRHRAFRRIALDAPALEVDTTDGYRPRLDQIVAFVNARTRPCNALYRDVP